MRAPRHRMLAARVELLQRVLAHGLEHREAQLVRRRVDLLDQALVDERRHPVEDRQAGVLAGIAHRLGGLEGAGAGEHREAAEQALLGVAQQLVAPVDRLAQRLLPHRQVGAAAGEQGQPPFEAAEHLRRREDADPRRRQLDGERQPVEAGADLRDRGRRCRRSGRTPAAARRPDGRTAPRPDCAPARRAAAAAPCPAPAAAGPGCTARRTRAGRPGWSRAASAPSSTRSGRRAAAPPRAAARSCRGPAACARGSSRGRGPAAPRRPSHVRCATARGPGPASARRRRRRPAIRG